MKCSQVKPLIVAWIENELDFPEQARVSLHVRSCPSCENLGQRLMAHQDALVGLRKYQIRHKPQSAHQEKTRSMEHGLSAPEQPMSLCPRRPIPKH